MKVFVGNIRGPQGERGKQGEQGDPGLPGTPAGFGKPTAQVTELSAAETPTVEITARGPDTQKVFDFQFGLPVGIVDGSVSKSKLDSSLQGAVDKANSAVQPAELKAEQQRATTAEQANDAAIKAEASRAQGAEQANASAIEAEGTRAKGIENGLTSRVTEIESKVPTQASADNQLADKAFVNSSVQTNTANPRGNWDNWSAVPTTADYPADAYGGKTPTVNDYLVVQDASGYLSKSLSGTWRFKYSGDWEQNGKDGWQPEYQVNREPLTAAQVAALDSGVTSAQVAQINSNKTDIAALKTENIEQASEIQRIKNGVGNLGALANKDTVGTDDVDDNAVTMDKVAQGAIYDYHISPDAAIEPSKIQGYGQTIENIMTTIESVQGTIESVQGTADLAIQNVQIKTNTGQLQHTTSQPIIRLEAGDGINLSLKDEGVSIISIQPEILTAEDVEALFNTPLYYTVTFDSQGGSPVHDQIVLPGERATQPPIPTKDDKAFKCWLNGEYNFSFTTPINEDTTLVAKWV